MEDHKLECDQYPLGEEFMRANEFIVERRANPDLNVKMPISQQIQQIIQKNGGTIDDYWIHCSPVEHVGFYGGGHTKVDSNDPAVLPRDFASPVGTPDRPMQAKVIPSKPFQGQVLNYNNVERGFRNRGKPRAADEKNGLWLSPLKPNFKYIDNGVIPFQNKFVFLVKLNNDAWVQPVNALNKIRANLVGIKPPEGKHKIGQYNPSSQIAVIFEPAFKVVGQWTISEIQKQAQRNRFVPDELKQVSIQKKARKAAQEKELDDLFEEPIDEAELDSTGWGATPQGTDVDYFGLKVKMRPSTFLKLSHPLNAGEQNSDVEKHMQGGGKIAYPFLEIKDPVEWEDGDFSQPGKVVNHEGRNRMTHWIKMKGDEPIQINVFLRGANRRRYVTDDMIQALSQGLISQTGQLVKNPFEASTALDEAEVGTSNAKAIATQLKAAGYSNVGTGADSTVWAKDDSHIIKILMPEDLSNKAEQVFRKFYDFAMSHQDLACMPRFNEVNTIDINGKDYTQIEMERLAPIEKGTFMEGVIWFFSDFCQAQESWDKVDHAMGLSDTWEWYPYAKSSKSIANVYIRQWQDLMYDKKSYSMYRQLYNVMKLLYNTGTINKFGWDLHTANVMQRSNGQPVIIDPWFSEGTS